MAGEVVVDLEPCGVRVGWNDGAVSLPEVVTHYYLADRRPFLNLSDLAGPQLDAVLAAMNRLRRAGRQHRPFGRQYMDLRRRTEERLRRLFVEAGGAPDRVAPHYLTLGESAWFEGLGEEMHRVQLPLAALPADKTSVTYPDSFTAMGQGEPFGLDQQSVPYHGRVFLLAELPALIERFGIPSPAWNSRHQDWTTWPAETFVEVQLWTDEPVRHYLC